MRTKNPHHSAKRTRRFSSLLVVTLLTLALPSLAPAEDLIIRFPEKSEISVATAIERDSAVNVGGTSKANETHFSNLQLGVPYDLAIELADGQLYCGADLSWCDPSPADPQAEPLADDDREAIRAIVQDILGFADKPKVIMLHGDHDRAVGLVDLARTKGFDSSKGDEVIWRVEVWFFKWQNGGWERVADQSRLLRRERFPSNAAYQKEIGRLHWEPKLGGVLLEKGADPTTLMISSPTTRASDSPAGSPPESPPPPP